MREVSFERHNLLRLDLEEINIISSSSKQVYDTFQNLLLFSESTNQVVTFNLDFYFHTKFNPFFREICKKSYFVFPDGYGITKLLKLKHKISVNRITGNDLFTILLDLANKHNLRAAFVGSSKDTLSKLIKKVRKYHSGITICEAVSPPNKFEYNEKINNSLINNLKTSNPDILFLALGSPRQEIWLAKYKNAIGAKINIGVGAVFDFYSGSKKRSPQILQNIGMEWMWRLFNEPQRLFSRYVLNDIPFFIKEYLNIRFSKWIQN